MNRTRTYVSVFGTYSGVRISVFLYIFLLGSEKDSQPPFSSQYFLVQLLAPSEIEWDDSLARELSTTSFFTIVYFISRSLVFWWCLSFSVFQQ